jgi:pyruvate-formate lyase
MTRVERLRQQVLEADDGTQFSERVYLCVEAWEQYQWDPPAIGTARILAHVLRRMSVQIDPDDLLVGRVAQAIPDQEQTRFLETHGRFGGILGQWTLAERGAEIAAAALSPQEVAIMGVYGTGPGGWRNGHTTPSWPIVLECGFVGIAADARARRAEIAPDSVERIRQIEFLRAVEISAAAMTHLAARYADAAAHLARRTQDAARRQELLDIPAEPARNLHEALQAVWLVQLVLSTVVGGRDFAPGRFDQYLEPYLRRDLDSGLLTAAQAQELIDCFFIKLNENIGRGAKHGLCVNSVQYLIIAGVNEDGADATNQVSYMCLDAVARLRLKQPTVVVRYHRDISPDFFAAACRVISLGTGNPSLFNDATMIPALQHVGIPLAEARDYGVIGCANPNIPGREGALNDHRLNLAKCLELALNDGVDPQSGIDTGLRTGRCESFAAFQDLQTAFLRHVDAQIGWWIRRNDLFDQTCASCVNDPLLSSLTEGCMASATDAYAGGATHFHNPYQAAGLATVADSLAAIRKLVYEDGTVSLNQLNEILLSDFAGHEELRLRLLHDSARFGNDQARVDELARETARHFCDSVMAHPTCWGNGHGNWPGIYSFGDNHVQMGRVTGATADGRHAGTPISFNLSPSLGCAQSGPTAEMRSVAGIEFERVSGGGTYDLKLDPESVRDPAALEALLCTYLELGGMQVQINVVDKDVLLAAQRHPEDYRDLLVRVTGYSAYFTALGKVTQDEIIARHEHAI